MTVNGIWVPGPLVITEDVDDAVLAVMQEWLPTYLKELSTERSLDFTIPNPQVWTNALQEDEFLDHQLPALIVTTAQTTRTIGGANYFYQAVWGVTVSIVVRGPNPRQTKKLASLYEGAVRRCFLQKCRSNTGPLSDPSWMGTEVAPVRTSEPNDQGRWLAAGIGKYNVATDLAAQSFGGPDVPDADDYVPLATVTDVVIDVESEE